MLLLCYEEWETIFNVYILPFTCMGMELYCYGHNIILSRIYLLLDNSIILTTCVVMDLYCLNLCLEVYQHEELNLRTSSNLAPHFVTTCSNAILWMYHITISVIKVKLCEIIVKMFIVVEI